MGKGVIKTTSTQQSASSAPVSTTITPPGGTSVTGANQAGQSTASAPPYGQAITGTLQDVTSGAIVNFNVAFGIEMGIAVGVKVMYNTVNTSGGVVANMVRLLEKGEILTINQDDTTGTLVDKASGSIIPFALEFATETGLTPRAGQTKGTMVHFETIVDPNSGNITAVALEVAG